MLSQKNLKMFATIKFWQDGFLLRPVAPGSVNPRALTVRSILFIAQKEQILQKKINVLKLLGFELFIKINT